MGPEIGAKVIAEAKKHIGAHYIHGGYGATPGNSDGCKCRPGMVNLIVSHDRLNPVFDAKPEKNIAVYAAQTSITHADGKTKYSVCAGNYNSFPGGRPANPRDWDLNNYLTSLKAVENPAHWPFFVRVYTPRRAFGPGADPSGDIGGVLVWGQTCAGIRHFDCVGFISYCLAAAGGPVIQLSIAAWRATPHSQGATVYELAKQKPKELLDGDIIVKADHHIAWVAKDGAIH